MNSRKNTVGIVPFYACAEKKDAKLIELQDTIAQLSEHVERIIIIDDGCDIFVEGKKIELLHIPTNTGKANAVRVAVKHILDSGIPCDYIIQSDFDNDQRASDANLLLNMFTDSDTPTLVLGNRYQNQSAEDIHTHRRALILFQEAFCELLGYPGIQDPMTGLRAYNYEFAKHFIQISDCVGFGLDVEQMMIATRIKARVLSTPLSWAKRRDTFTPINKFWESLSSIILNAPHVNGKEAKVIAFYDRLEKGIRSGQSFDFPLQLGENMHMVRFNRVDSTCQMEIL